MARFLAAVVIPIALLLACGVGAHRLVCPRNALLRGARISKGIGLVSRKIILGSVGLLMGVVASPTAWTAMVRCLFLLRCRLHVWVACMSEDKKNGERYMKAGRG